MKFPAPRSLMGLAALALVSTSALADGYRGGLKYEVTITNLTRGQIFSPPLVVTHPDDLALFEAGAPASPELAALAQDGEAADLADLLAGERGVRVKVADGPVLPGGHITLKIRARSPRSVLSVASMLVSSNDAFLAVDGAPLPRSRNGIVTRTATAYDAGAEANDEDCAHIPGPPCGNPFVPSGALSEGYVHVHAGIHGIGGLDEAEFDWRNPVAKITVRRVGGR